MKKVIHFFRTPALTENQIKQIMILQLRTSPDIKIVKTEYCFNVEITEELSNEELTRLIWLFSETFEPDKFSSSSFLAPELLPNEARYIVEVGPRLNFTTAWSTNAVEVCRNCGINKVTRIERSRRFLIETPGRLTKAKKESFLTAIHDRMTECEYSEPLQTFETNKKPEPVREIQIIEKGEQALIDLNKEMGLGLDPWDINYYYELFTKDIGRNPTDAECFDLSQSNSEHSRHWFFLGKLIVDGKEAPHTLMELLKKPRDKNPGNSVIAFNDNSSSIKGYKINTIVPIDPGISSSFRLVKPVYNPIFTAETHNFPSGVAPFPGAETGTGGRIRDIQATGTGGLVVAGAAAYCVGNLQIPGYELPWENKSFKYPFEMASPLKIEIEASNGASDYGNKFGEPVIQGYTRSFGMKMPSGERYEWIKPIMFTSGIGQMNAEHTKKGEPKKGMLVVKIGGPAYRIGMGGGAASSQIQGAISAKLNFNAVQRGDAEMAKKVDRVIRACIEMRLANPIVSIHDQGAGGNCNVLKEVIYPAGAKIILKEIPLGDTTLSVLEIWGAEYQENNALLIMPEHYETFKKKCLREKVPCSAVGHITEDGYVVLHDERDDSTPVNLDLEKILGDMPQKTFKLDRVPMEHKPLELPDLTVMDALKRVLRLLSVGSKRFLANKVDRSVTGLVARQQCAGPLQLTVSDVAVVAQSHFPNDDGKHTGSAISIGERPILTLLDPAKMSRMATGEMLTNLVWALISSFEDIKCSGNWMWAGKLPGEGAKLYDAAVALSDILTKLEIAIDGGKDSMSMATKVDGEDEPVKSPGTLVMSAYVTCPDITKVITPDIKKPGESRLYYIDLSGGNKRLGGSALAQVYSQIGNESPDVDSPELLKETFNVVQEMIRKDLILSGHDRSDGGLIVTILEMLFSGNCGALIDFFSMGDQTGPIPDFFNEELGLVIEVSDHKEVELIEFLRTTSVRWHRIGSTTKEKRVVVYHETSGRRGIVLDEDMRVLRELWEETSYQLERLQTNPECADEEKKNIYDRPEPQYHIPFDPALTEASIFEAKTKPKVAIIREEGSNSDREMTSAFFQAGFEVHDVTMTDLIEGTVTLKDFRGIAFVGGFSYADVLDAAKGWAGVIKFNEKVRKEFNDFYNREDAFSLGICNGCQLMALLGWIPWQDIPDDKQPRFIQNTSGKFESRWSTVTILDDSPSIMLNGMGNLTFGIPVAHGEGRFYLPDDTIIEDGRMGKLMPVRYVDDTNNITQEYPFNPNGSQMGVAGVCSEDGRHLAMMPHPERAFLPWQCHWTPEDLKKDLMVSPWLKMFQNAREWCEKD